MSKRATELVALYDEWRTERTELSEREWAESGDPEWNPVDADEWHDSDDAGIELLHEFAAALREEGK
jgi:hypothetical protein